MTEIILEIVFILVLVLINGLLALAEIAVVTARKLRLQQSAEKGDKRAEAALELANAPSRFLSTVQIGITLVGIVAGTVGGATISEQIAVQLQGVPLLAPYSEALGIAIVVVGITYLSLVFGELVPKRIAMGNPERTAAWVARPMRLLARLTAPFVRVLSFSTDAVLRIFGVRSRARPVVTEDDVRVMIAQGARSGVFEPEEAQMVQKIFRLADRKVNALVTPHTEIAWLDVNESPKELRRKIESSAYSYYPVGEDSLDNLLGVVHSRDLLAQSLAGEAIDLRAALQPALTIPEAMPALDVLEQFKTRRAQVALVFDEFGSIAGLVTVTDILEAIVGDLPDADELVEPEAVQRADGSWLLDGMLPIDEFMELFAIKAWPDEGEKYYQTLGGFVMTFLGRVPKTGEQFVWQELRFEVVDMDGQRVDKVLVAPIAGN